MTDNTNIELLEVRSELLAELDFSKIYHEEVYVCF